MEWLICSMYRDSEKLVFAKKKNFCDASAACKNRIELHRGTKKFVAIQEHVCNYLHNSVKCSQELQIQRPVKATENCTDGSDDNFAMLQFSLDI